MNLEILRILIDFGIVVLIWMVQILIYPSLLYFRKEELYLWHKKYTKGMFITVMPLMVGQLAISIVQLFQDITLFSIIYVAGVVALWSITFLQFVPLHGRISENKSDALLLKTLVSRNWARTVLWTVLFVLSVYNFIISS